MGLSLRQQISSWAVRFRRLRAIARRRVGRWSNCVPYSAPRVFGIQRRSSARTGAADPDPDCAEVVAGPVDVCAPSHRLCLPRKAFSLAWLVFKQSRMEGKPWSNSATGAGMSRDSQKVHQDNAYCGDEVTVPTDYTYGRRPVGDSLLARNPARFAELARGDSRVFFRVQEDTIQRMIIDKRCLFTW
jgi:hypothetical protein